MRVCTPLISAAIALAALHPVTALSGTAPTVLISANLDTARQDGRMEIDLLFSKEAGDASAITAPERLEAEIQSGSVIVTAPLVRAQSDPGQPDLDAGRFHRVRYRLTLPAGLTSGSLATIRVPALQTNSAALVIPNVMPTALAQGPNVSQNLPSQTEPDAATEAERLEPSASAPSRSALPVAYEPIYALIGNGTNTNAKIQFSFKYRLFGESSFFGNTRTLLDGVYFAYTQRMFWDISRDSAPFRNIDFQPELIYILPQSAPGDRTRFGLQFGVRHESNGREGDASRSVNTAYIQPSLGFRLGKIGLNVAPQAWFYFGGQDGNRDIEHYRGHTGLALLFREPGGLQIDTRARMNLGNGKGAVQADISYPLNRLVWDRLKLYLYGQVFSGYGENLLDYNQRIDRVRIGIGIVR